MRMPGPRRPPAATTHGPGSANDIVSVVATLAMIPAALLLLVLGLMPFAVQTDISCADLICIFGWVFAASPAGRAPVGGPARSPTAA